MKWLKSIFKGKTVSVKTIPIEEVCIGDVIMGIGIVESKYIASSTKNWRIWIKGRVQWIDIEKGQEVKVEE